MSERVAQVFQNLLLNEMLEQPSVQQEAMGAQETPKLWENRNCASTSWVSATVVAISIIIAATCDPYS
jgi:hypothetical protein